MVKEDLSLKSRPRYIWLALGLVAICLSLSLSASPASARAASEMAFVRVVHASPDVGVVDVFVDRARFLSSFQFASVTEYAPLAAGSHTLQIALIGKGIDAAVMTRTMTVEAGKAYTIAALGTKATGFSLTIFTDDNAVAGNLAKLRIYHLSPGTGTVNVEMGTKPVIQSLTYPQVSSYVAISGGTYTLHLTSAAMNITAPFSTTLKPWTVTSVFAIGVLAGTPSLRFVTAEVQGTPGMPNTGSDPNAVVRQHAQSAPDSAPFAAASLGGLSAAGLLFWGLTRARTRRKAEKIG